MRKLMFVCSLCIGVLFLGACTKKNQESSDKGVVKMDVIGLDVRTAEELQANPSAESLHIPMAKLQNEALGQLPNKNQKILVFCEAGGRASKAQEMLKDMGYTNVENIGSWRDWNKRPKE